MPVVRVTRTWTLAKEVGMASLAVPARVDRSLRRAVEGTVTPTVGVAVL